MSIKETFILVASAVVLCINMVIMGNLSNKILRLDDPKELTDVEKINKQLDVALQKVRNADAALNILFFEKLAADDSNDNDERELLYKKLALNKEYKKISDAYISMVDDSEVNKIIKNLEKK